MPCRKEVEAARPTGRPPTPAGKKHRRFVGSIWVQMLSCGSEVWVLEGWRNYRSNDMEPTSKYLCGRIINGLAHISYILFRIERIVVRPRTCLAAFPIRLGTIWWYFTRGSPFQVNAPRNLQCHNAPPQLCSPTALLSYGFST